MWNSTIFSNSPLKMVIWSIYPSICLSVCVHLHYCAKVMLTPVNKIQRNSWLFNEFLTGTKLRWYLHEFQGMYCFEWLELSVTYSLMTLMWLKISSKNMFYAASIWGENLLLLFILSWWTKRFCWICGLVLLYVKLLWNFLLRFESPCDLCCLKPWQHSVCQLFWCIWDQLFTLLLVVIAAKVSNYSTKKSRSSTSKASTQLKYWRRWNAKGY